MGVKPRIVVDDLWLSLGVLEFAGDERAAIDQARVRRKDEVRQALHRLHRLYRSARALDVRDEITPLFVSQVTIGSNLCMHPGIYLVEDAKVIWWAHQVCVAPVQRPGLVGVIGRMLCIIRASHQKNSSNLFYLV